MWNKCTTQYDLATKEDEGGSSPWRWPQQEVTTFCELSHAGKPVTCFFTFVDLLFYIVIWTTYYIRYKNRSKSARQKWMEKKYGEMRKSKERVSVVQVHDLLIRKRLCETHHCVCQDKWMFAEENDFKTEMCETLEAVPGTQRPMSAASVISHQISTFIMLQFSHSSWRFGSPDTQINKCDGPCS